MFADSTPPGAVLYLAWNFKLKPRDMWTLRQTRDIRCLPSFFTSKSFPAEINRSKLITCVQFGISLKPGIPAKAFEADSFKIVAVAVHGGVPDKPFMFSNLDDNQRSNILQEPRVEYQNTRRSVGCFHEVPTTA